MTQQRHDNALQHATNPKWLYVSLWAKRPDDTLRYDNCHFVTALALKLDESVPPIPVRADLATATYLRSRKYAYEWEQYRPEDAPHEWRVRITGVVVDMTSGDSTRVTLPFDEFLPRYHADSRYYEFEDEVPAAIDSDDDEEEDKRPARRRIAPS